jgi:hypothetical protein
VDFGKLLRELAIFGIHIRLLQAILRTFWSRFEEKADIVVGCLDSCTPRLFQRVEVVGELQQ